MTIEESESSASFNETQDEKEKYIPKPHIFGSITNCIIRK